MSEEQVKAIWLDMKEGIEQGEIDGPSELVYYLSLMYDDEIVHRVFQYYKKYIGLI